MNLQDLGATEIIGIAVITVILALAIIGFVKGLMRTLMSLVCIGLAGYAAFWGNEHAHDFTASWSAIPGIWAPKIVALITGVIAFAVVRYLLNFLIDPFNDSQTGKKIGFGLPAAALSLVAGLALIWLGFTGIRYAASLSQLYDAKRMLLADHPEEVGEASVILLRLQRALDTSEIGQWQRKTDPFYKSGKLKLSKLLVMYHDESARIEMLKNKSVSQLLNDPTFIDLAYSDDLKRYEKSGKPREIFNAKALTKALENPAFSKLFQKLDYELTQPPPSQIQPQTDQK